MVGLGGLEPPTSPLSGVHSNQLSYRPLIQNTDCGLLIAEFAFAEFCALHSVFCNLYGGE